MNNIDISKLHLSDTGTDCWYSYVLDENNKYVAFPSVDDLLYVFSQLNNSSRYSNLKNKLAQLDKYFKLFKSRALAIAVIWDVEPFFGIVENSILEEIIKTNIDSYDCDLMQYYVEHGIHIDKFGTKYINKIVKGSRNEIDGWPSYLNTDFLGNSDIAYYSIEINSFSDELFGHLFNSDEQAKVEQEIDAWFEHRLFLECTYTIKALLKAIDEVKELLSKEEENGK